MKAVLNKRGSVIFLMILLLAVVYIVFTKGNKPNTIHKTDYSALFADSIISQLALEEKVSLLHGMGGGNSEFGDQDVRYFGIKGIKEKDIPPFYMGHGITGVRTGRDTAVHATYVASPIAMGCSWDTKLYGDVATAIAKELRATGNDLCLGPTYNIIRHPLGGRNWESISEDPFLSAQMAVSYTKSIQENGIVCGPKHFVANNQEANRFDINNEVDERTLREIYLPAFKAAVVKGGAMNIMGAYNRVNGDYMCHNEYLLDSVLRGEWGFDGFVLSDFANGVKNTREAIDARMNVEMHRPKFYGDSLVRMVNSGAIPEQRIDTLLKDVLKVMHRFNIFERKRVEGEGSIHSKAHIELAHKVAKESPVLLKNKKNVLPLSTTDIESLAVIGPNAKRFPSVTEKHPNYAYYLQGGGSGRTYYFHNTLVEPYTGILNALDKNVKTTYVQGTKTPDLYSKNKTIPEDSDDVTLLNEAVQAAESSEVAVVVVGLSGFNETEGWDRASAKLPGLQEKLIREVAKVSPKTIVVLISGSYIDVSEWIDDIDGLLYVPYCGEQIGNGIADILFGKNNPSGKLPISWPVSVEDYPEGTIFTGKGFEEEGISNTYSEGIFVGYRWFEKDSKPVLFPFGYGLSYTQFAYDDIQVDQGDFPIRVKATITNNGDVYGKEIVQLYLSAINPNIEKAPIELKGFDKIGLESGQSQTVEFLLNKEDFAHYDVTKKSWVIDPGAYKIGVGTNVRNLPLETEITLKGEILDQNGQ